ncbi:lipopolysaccharide biosynthesis protein [Kitasatospora sp. NPDC056783]|uniref:lipopolysaccharide biosynthesis protein n=1 Tax=Kitasatospora sp. NPDC056783 TaxID=3345943 RepID=UPI00368D065C
MKNPLTKVAAALPPGTLAVGGGTVVLGAASYIHLGVAGHSLSVDDMAKVSLLWTIVMSVGIGVFFPIEQELTRIVSARAVLGHGAAPVLRRATLLAGGILAVTLAALAAASGPIARGMFHGDRSLVLALGGAFTGMAVCYVTRGVLAGLGRFGAYGTQLGLDGGLRIGLALAFGVAGVHSALAFSLILAIAPILATIVTLPPLLRAAKPGEQIGWSELCSGLGLLICSTLLSQVVVNAAVMSTKLLAPSDSALIAALLNALVLARVPLFVFGSLQASLLNGLSAAIAVGDRAAFTGMLKKIGVVVGALGVLGGIPAVALGPWLIQVLFGAKPVLGCLDFFWLSAGTVAYMFAMVLGQALMVFKRHNLQLLCWAVGTAVLAGVTFLPGEVSTRVILAYTAGSVATVLGMLAVLRQSFARSATTSAGSVQQSGDRDTAVLSSRTAGE